MLKQIISIMKLYNIRKYIGCIKILVVSLFISCQNDAVDIVREDVKINIILTNVLSPFISYENNDMEMYKEGDIVSKIIVKAFVYDDSGHLINKFSKEITDYKKSSISFSTSLTGSNPQVVCFTYATFKYPSGETYDAYTVKGEELLATLKVEQDYASYGNRIPWQTLGGTIQSLGNSSGKIDVEVKPLGSIVYVDYENIHAHDGTKESPDRYVFLLKYNNVAMVKDGRFSFSSSLSSNYYFLDETYPANFPKFTSVYSIRFMFPGNVKFYGYGDYSPSNYTKENDNVITGKSDTKNIHVDAGKQYIFKMDCKDYSIDVKEGILND